MTHGQSDNSRFAFIPRRVWDLLLDLAPLPLAGTALWLSLDFVRLLCVIHDGYGGSFQPIRYVFAEWNLIHSFSATLAGAVCLIFIAHTIFRRHKKAGSGDRIGFGRSGYLIATATIAVLMIGHFWLLDVRLSQNQLMTINIGARHSVVFGGAWAVAAATAISLRLVGRRLEALCLAPPVVSFAVALMRHRTASDALRTLTRIVERAGQRMTDPAVQDILLLAAACALLSVPLLLWAERRLFRSSSRTIGIACAALWALTGRAAVDQLWMSVPYY